MFNKLIFILITFLIINIILLDFKLIYADGAKGTIIPKTEKKSGIGFGPNDDPIGYGSNKSNVYDIVFILIKHAASFILNLIPSIAVLMVIYGGFQYIQGSLDQKTSGAQTFIYAIKGFLLAVMSYIIVSFVLSFIIGIAT